MVSSEFLKKITRMYFQKISELLTLKVCMNKYKGESKVLQYFGNLFVLFFKLQQKQLYI